MDNTFTDAFDAELFRAQGHGVVEQLAEYLGRVTGQHGDTATRRRGDTAMPVLAVEDADALVEHWPDRFPQEAAADPVGALRELLADVMAHSNHLHSPRYVGHQVTSPLPQAAVTELFAALLNNAMAVYEMGPAASAMERSLIRWMGTQCGFDRKQCDGVMTSGGSAGNLTALLAARQDRAGFDAWREGSAGGGGPPLAILAGESAHYSVKRAVQIMGWGEGGVIPVPVDAGFRIRAECLQGALEEGRRRGRKVIGVAAAGCSTATGAFDRLAAVADLCAKEGLWLHVDGAHGAAALLSPKYRRLLAGIERADSVVWDTHKMLLMPAPATAVIFRRGACSAAAFAQQASYLFGGTPEVTWYDIGQRTLECTKRQMSLHLYAALMVRGTTFFADYVTRMFDLGAAFGEMLATAEDFELPVRPECNIVCFRYRPRAGGGKAGMGAEELDALNARVRRRIVESGRFYLVQTKLPSGLHLRVTLINPLTTERELAELMTAVREEAADDKVTR